MTRNGKIARLPRPIRNALNIRLDNGEQSPEILLWLNALPEVQALITAEFEGHPVSKQNLSEWKAGGFLDWQRGQESCDRVRGIFELADDLDTAAENHPFPDRLASVLAAELAGETRRLMESTTDPKERWRYLCEALRHLSTLRLGDRLAARAALDRLHLEIESHRRKEEEAAKEEKRIREESTKPLLDAMRREAIKSAFGGGERGEKIADYMQKITNPGEAPPGSSPKTPVSKPDSDPSGQAQSN